jgi:hypothetical protein
MPPRTTVKTDAGPATRCVEISSARNLCLTTAFAHASLHLILVNPEQLPKILQVREHDHWRCFGAEDACQKGLAHGLVCTLVFYLPGLLQFEEDIEYVRHEVVLGCSSDDGLQLGSRIERYTATVWFQRSMRQEVVVQLSRLTGAAGWYTDQMKLQ